MKQFLTKIIYFSLFGIVPLLILILSYIYYDPFKVLRDYDDYSYSYIIPDRDYVSTEVYIKNNKKYNYNSFIFGSSRTLAYKPDSWVKYLQKDARPYVFDASTESIYGIYIKLKYLDSLNKKIDNALIIICRDNTFENTENQKGHLFIKHPATTGDSELDFQATFFKSYLSPFFFANFHLFQITKQYKPYMSGYIDDRKIRFDRITNALTLVDPENELIKSPHEFYEKRKEIFYVRKGERIDSVQRIQKKQLFMLKEIKRILKKHKTDYKIVVSPLYEQVKFSLKDSLILKQLFGDKIYDFSGKNFITDYKTNYYETSHYRPMIGDKIFNLIYKK